MATAPGYRRTRKEIQALLWSDRAEVWLEAGRADPDSSGDEGEFLAGVETGDPAFEGWLRLERLLHQKDPISGLDSDRASSVALKRPCVLIVRDPDLPAMTAMVTNLFADHLSRSLSEQFSVDIETVTPRGVPTRDPSALIFSTEAQTGGAGSGAAAAAALVRASAGRRAAVRGDA